MEAHTASRPATDGTDHRSDGIGARLRHFADETKQAFKTTEFWLTVAVIVGILVSAASISAGEEGADEFLASQAWLYVAILAGLYAVGRGLAKSGTRHTDDDHQHRD